MKKISLQQIFDLAWQAFIVERKQPGYDKGVHSCRYLDDEGNKCAIGLALPDGHPTQKSLCSFYTLMTHNRELFNDSLTSLNEAQANHFQASLHDSYIDEDSGSPTYGQWALTPRELEKRYKEVAKKYNLTIPTK